MRVHESPKQTRERKIIHVMLIACITLGFISVAFVYLPSHLKAIKANHSKRDVQLKNFSNIIPEKPVEKKTNQITVRPGEPIFRFIPEEDPEPLPPPRYAAAKEAPEDSPIEIQQENNLPEDYEVQKEDIPPRIDFGSTRTVRHKISSLVDGSAGRQSSRGEKWWKSPRGLETDVNFWKDVYTKYPSTQVLLHDSEHLEIIYDIIDFSKTNNDPRLSEIQKEKIRKDRIDEEREKIIKTLAKMDTHRETALRTKLGRKIARLFATVDEKNKYKKAKERGVRAQTGQSDKFLEGLKRSGAYLGEIELIFKSYGLPRELTRMIFVESMFQVEARSKVGAAGIWQFMPGTGRKYLRINKFTDERLDPILATHAAAKLLKHNYEVLESWPLAINAYNAGRGRLAQAVKRVGTNDIAKIIQNFDHPSYGFASRNFFLEFVAAREIVDNAQHYFGVIEYDSPLSYDIVELPFHISLPEVSRLTSVSIDEIYRLNPALSDKFFDGRLLTPKGTTLRVPEKKGDYFLQLASRATKTNKDQLTHIVSKGESVSQIAGMYGVSADRIREANPKLKRKLRRGQKLYIPFD